MGSSLHRQPHADLNAAEPSFGELVKRSAVRNFAPVVIPVVLMWIVFAVSLALGNWFNRELGLQARHFSGLTGIVFMPLLHGSVGHLIGNTTSWLVLGSITSLMTKRFFPVMAMIWVISGAVLWLIGTPWICNAPQGTSCVVNHVGASAVIYGLAAFIVTYAVIARRFWPLLVAVFVAVVYGISMLIGMLPIGPGVSWTGHISGAVAGVLVGFIFTREARAQRLQRRRARELYG